LVVTTHSCARCSPSRPAQGVKLHLICYNDAQSKGLPTCMVSYSLNHSLSTAKYLDTPQESGRSIKCLESTKGGTDRPINTHVSRSAKQLFL
jgi:hypothetical protein